MTDSIKVQSYKLFIIVLEKLTENTAFGVKEFM